MSRLNGHCGQYELNISSMVGRVPSPLQNQLRIPHTPVWTVSQFEEGSSLFHSYAKPRMLSINNRRKSNCISPDEVFTESNQKLIPFQSYSVLNDAYNDSVEGTRPASGPLSTVNLEESDEEELHCFNKDPFLSDTVDIKKPNFKISSVTGSAFNIFQGSVPSNTSKNDNNRENLLSAKKTNRVFVIKNDKTTAEALGKCIEAELCKTMYDSSSSLSNTGTLEYKQKSQNNDNNTLQRTKLKTPQKNGNKRKNYTPTKLCRLDNDAITYNSKRSPLSPLSNGSWYGTTPLFTGDSFMMSSPVDSSFNSWLKLDEDTLLLDPANDKMEDVFSLASSDNTVPHGWCGDSLESQPHSQESGFQSFCGSESSEHFTPVSRSRTIIESFKK